MSLHVFFDGLPRQSVLCWERRARADKQSKLEEQAASCTHLHGHSELFKARHEEWLAKFGIANHVESCRLGPNEMQGLLEAFNTIDLNTMELVQSDVLVAPALPSEEE